MAAYSSILPLFTIIILAQFINFEPTISCFTSIISFGDSLADTGNYVLSGAQPCSVGRSPYGETYFHHATGRFSDGRIVLDFIAEAMGLPHVPPYLGGGPLGKQFPNGVNFAVGGATAVGSQFFWEKGIQMSTNYSLAVQTAWFRQLLPSLCTDCSGVLSQSLFFVGEIGGNDYNIPLSQGRELGEIMTYVPGVIDAISSTIDDLIALGAKTLVVPSYLPVGCLSAFLARFPNSSRDPHTGCVEWLNEFAEYHDQKLLEELDRVRLRHPSATVVYADQYNAAMNIFQNPRHYGFGNDHLSACCGGGGPYNYNASAECGSENANVCSDPSKLICFDGMHLTEAAYRAIASQLVHGPLAVAPISNACHIRLPC